MAFPQETKQSHMLKMLTLEHANKFDVNLLFRISQLKGFCFS